MLKLAGCKIYLPLCKPTENGMKSTRPYLRNHINRQLVVTKKQLRSFVTDLYFPINLTHILVYTSLAILCVIDEILLLDTGIRNYYLDNVIIK